jgi:hypothetical protein
MFGNIIKIAFLCIVIGAASIPVSFTIDSSPFIVWLGNALGSLISALVVIYIADRLTSDRFKDRVRKFRIGNKIVKIFDQGDDNEHIKKASGFINKHGLRLFALFCPIFPGALIATAAVYLLGLNTKIYRFWLTIGIFLVSGAYVFGYWFVFVKPH